ncbi:baculoviral IAP repeat-containing protein 3-like [Mercenaria mercenaria]|uniref:baculoviral IAP repeat-containing protein 3-like n=1 Tax=Mercenaria mercenaria TaxID=6596 RepID=UPI00234ECE11|nr:baculoviral IAP repeat-containing protein 3-like [Mercenaria mercenaria]
MDQTDSVPLPVSTDFMFYEDRLSTFKKWPKQMSQKQTDLAKSGFYYTGENDAVKCFSCKIKLHNMESNDIPMQEHSRWSPNCVFLNMIGPKCLGFLFTPAKTFKPTIPSRCFVLETSSSTQNSSGHLTLDSKQSTSNSGFIFGKPSQDTGLTSTTTFQTAGQKRLSDFKVEPHHFVKQSKTSGFGCF